MKKLFKFLFNTNTGYFIQKVPFEYEGNIEFGYIVCRGYKVFGIFGYDRIAYCHDRETLINSLKNLNIQPCEIR